MSPPSELPNPHPQKNYDLSENTRKTRANGDDTISGKLKRRHSTYVAPVAHKWDFHLLLTLFATYSRENMHEKISWGIKKNADVWDDEVKGEKNSFYVKYIKYDIKITVPLVSGHYLLIGIRCIDTDYYGTISNLMNLTWKKWEDQYPHIHVVTAEEETTKSWDQVDCDTKHHAIYDLSKRGIWMMTWLSKIEAFSKFKIQQVSNPWQLL